MKKAPGDIIILHKYTKNHDQIYTNVPKIMIISILFPRYDVDRCNFYFSFWAIFCPFIPPTPNNPKNQNFTKMEFVLADIII